MPLTVGKTPVGSTTAVQGKTFYREFLLQYNGAAIPGGIAGAHPVFVLREANKESGAPVILAATCAVLDSVTCKVSVSFTSVQLASIASGNYYAEGEITLVNGETYPWIYYPGSFLVDPEVV